MCPHLGFSTEGGGEPGDRVQIPLVTLAVLVAQVLQILWFLLAQKLTLGLTGMVFGRLFTQICAVGVLLLEVLAATFESGRPIATSPMQARRGFQFAREDISSYQGVIQLISCDTLRIASSTQGYN